jgi:hypothetical protein
MQATPAPEAAKPAVEPVTAIKPITVPIVEDTTGRFRDPSRTPTLRAAADEPDDGLKLLDPYPPKKPVKTMLEEIPWTYWAAGGAGLAILIGVLVGRGTGEQLTVNGLRGRKIVGTFCEEELAPKRGFDSRSFRWKRTGSSWLMTGCPRGKWDAKEQYCRVGTRGYTLLSPTNKRKRCPVGARRITKGK